MNVFLNRCVQESMMPSREKLVYKHRYERDSFAILSPGGVAALPPAAREEASMSRNGLSLRTTVDTDPKLKASTPPVIARIVKIRLVDLDIYSPLTNFDTRISVNIEVDLHNRDDMDTSLLTIPAEQEKERRPDRHKNRLSYTHLSCYSIDLTQVTNTDTGAKTHELEVEVDAVRLRQQAVLLQQDKPSAFAAMVSGLLNDVKLLMAQA